MLGSYDLKRVRNIVIFLSDALRYDHLPDDIRDMGLSSKMIAASNCTAPSLSTMVTGLYPFRHEVFTFKDRLPKKMFNLLNLEGMNTTFRTENTWSTYKSFKLNPIYRMLNQERSVALNNIEPPFIYIEDEKGGHCPYGWDEGDIYEEGDCISFFREYGKKSKSDLIERYEKGIERSEREFRKRLNTIRERGLEEETLVIFLSDHGELLSDYGNLIGHGNVTLPEIIYVPIVFIHPNIKPGKNRKGVVSHVDLVPTILDILGKKANQTLDGISLKKQHPMKNGISYWRFDSERKILGRSIKVSYEENSVWDRNGGYVFKNKGEGRSRLIKSIHDLYSKQNIQSIYLRSRFKRNPLQAMISIPRMVFRYTARSNIYGKEEISTNDAIELVKGLKDMKIKYNEKAMLKDRIRSMKMSRF